MYDTKCCFIKCVKHQSISKIFFSSLAALSWGEGSREPSGGLLFLTSAKEVGGSTVSPACCCPSSRLYLLLLCDLLSALKTTCSTVMQFEGFVRFLLLHSSLNFLSSITSPRPVLKMAFDSRSWMSCSQSEWITTVPPFSFYNHLPQFKVCVNLKW